jgi:hypothetical protein
VKKTKAKIKRGMEMIKSGRRNKNQRGVAIKYSNKEKERHINRDRNENKE